MGICISMSMVEVDSYLIRVLSCSLRTVHIPCDVCRKHAWALRFSPLELWNWGKCYQAYFRNSAWTTFSHEIVYKYCGISCVSSCCVILFMYVSNSGAIWLVLAHFPPHSELPPQMCQCFLVQPPSYSRTCPHMCWCPCVQRLSTYRHSSKDMRILQGLYHLKLLNCRMCWH